MSEDNFWLDYAGGIREARRSRREQALILHSLVIRSDSMNAGNIMTSNVVSVRPDTSVSRLARLLLDNRISAVPVVDEQGCLVGIVSEGDLLGRPPRRSLRARWLRLFDEEAVCLEELATARRLRAQDVMTHPVVSVSDQAPVDIVATLMHRHRVKRVPVIRDGKLVGIISRADLLKAFVGSREEPTVSSLGDLA